MVAVVVDLVILPRLEHGGDGDLAGQASHLHPLDHPDRLHRTHAHVPRELQQEIFKATLVIFIRNAKIILILPN